MNWKLFFAAVVFVNLWWASGLLPTLVVAAFIALLWWLRGINLERLGEAREPMKMSFRVPGRWRWNKD
jgi:hypothetical protein